MCLKKKKKDLGGSGKYSMLNGFQAVVLCSLILESLPPSPEAH